MSGYDDRLVSIITPAFNSERYIEETINSVVKQSYPCWELLIVDDCSVDNTYNKIAQAASTDPRIRMAINADNAGPAVTRNNAINLANGRYIAFLDSDDIWMPKKLEQQLSFMNREDAPFTYTAFRRISENGENVGELIQIPGSMNYYSQLKNTAIATSTVMLDRKIIGDIKMTKTYYDDYVLWLELMKKGITAYGLNEDLMRYRVVCGSVSRNKVRSAYHVWRTYRDIENLGLIRSIWSFFHYARNGYKKYKKF